MPLVTTTEMFQKAYEGGYAIGAFNVNNMEIVQGITEAAKEVSSPLILQVSAVEDTGLPIALHLDHGEDFAICKACIDGGFTSVMIDGSKHSFADNIALTRQVVEYAHQHGVVVEGELGRLAGIEDDVNVSAEDSSYTDPNQVEEFVRATGAWVPHCTPRGLVGGSPLCGAHQRQRRPAEGCHRRAGGSAPPGGQNGGVQD